MANINAPRGFKPIKQVGSNAAWNGGLTPYQIISGYATTIYTGDVVKAISTGYINKAAAGDQMRGVAMGFKWRAIDGTPVVSSVWPSGTVTLGALPAEILVIDDPDIQFEAQFGGAATVPTVALRGENFNLYDGGSNPPVLSTEGIDITTNTTSAAQFRFLDFVARPDNDTAAAYARGIFLPALHDFRVNTGI